MANRPAPAPKYVDFCLRCGLPLEQKEQEFELLKAHYVRFGAHEQGEITLHLCPGCTKVVFEEYIPGGIRAAVERQKAMSFAIDDSKVIGLSGDAGELPADLA